MCWQPPTQTTQTSHIGLGQFSRFFCRSKQHPRWGPDMSRRVLITGGAQRLGAELVQCFARAGWQVWCHYHRSAAQAQALQERMQAEGLRIELIAAELGDESALRAMMDRIATHGGALQALVNNAALFDPDTGLDFKPDQALRQLQVNLLAPLLLGQLLAQQQAVAAPQPLQATAQAQPQPTSAPTACLIHILDQKVFNLNPDYFSYTLSKQALERAVALQAQALAPMVRVCGVAPGLLYLSGPQSPENFLLASRINLLRQPIAPQDVAKTCLFMAETPSINGSTLCVDKGQHLVPLNQDVMFAVDQWLAARP